MMWQMHHLASLGREVRGRGSPSLAPQHPVTLENQDAKFLWQINISGAPTHLHIWPGVVPSGAHREPGNGVTINGPYSWTDGPNTCSLISSIAKNSEVTLPRWTSGMVQACRNGSAPKSLLSRPRARCDVRPPRLHGSHLLRTGPSRTANLLVDESKTVISGASAVFE